MTIALNIVCNNWLITLFMTIALNIVYDNFL